MKPQPLTGFALLCYLMALTSAFAFLTIIESLLNYGT